MAKIGCTCEQCGEKFEIPYLSYGKGRFCSHKCASESNQGEGNPNWKGHTIKKICKECGCEFDFKAYPSSIEKGEGIFCSIECKGNWQAKNLKGENNPRWKQKIKCICEECGKEFEIQHAWAKRGQGKYCSRLCSRRARKIPTHHTKPELIFEQICKKNNLDFHYVGDGQLWIGKGKVLNPDFIEANGKKICIEIMGAYWHSPLLNKNLHENALQPYREKHYRKYKWIPVFIWDTDLLRKDAEQFILNKLGELK